jgi:glyoxylase-like metal-dependent hydrolase (beta-lactamase superfamily II)
MEVELQAIRTGQVATPAGYVFRRGDSPLRFARALLPPWETVDLACLAFVVRHPTAGVLLVDTGLHADAISDLRRDYGAPMSLLFRRLKPAREPFDEQLRALGVEPDEVERVVMTHLHVDHTSGMRLLPAARFVCARKEWTAATARGAAARGYVGHHLPTEERLELLDFDRDGEPFGHFRRTIDLLGDGSVRLVSTRGHTAGHMSVLLSVAGGRRVLLVGDAAYTVRSIEQQILPLITVREDHYRQTLRELKAFADAEPEARLVPSHDPDAWREPGAGGGQP